MIINITLISRTGGLPIEDVYYPFNLKVNLNISQKNDWLDIQNRFEQDKENKLKFVLNSLSTQKESIVAPGQGFKFFNQYYAWLMYNEDQYKNEHKQVIEFNKYALFESYEKEIINKLLRNLFADLTQQFLKVNDNKLEDIGYTIPLLHFLTAINNETDYNFIDNKVISFYNKKLGDLNPEKPTFELYDDPLSKVRILEGEKESGLLYNADNNRTEDYDKYINLISNTIKRIFYER